MKKVRMFGPIGDSSGYGSAVRNFAEAFSISNIPVQFNFPKNKMNFVKGFRNFEGATNTDFYLHCPPFTKHKSSNYKIGYFYWEADKLPHSWAKDLNFLDEIWAPCELVRKACLEAGFKKTIKIVPTPIKTFDLSIKTRIPSAFSSKDVLSDKIFKFYSIFQWHERKGYKELLKAYLKEFSSYDDVVLILKVNTLNIRGYDSQKVRNDILKIKKYIGNKNSPPIFLSEGIIPLDQIYALHNSADCYVSAHHGEGWGMPIHDAMYAKRQLILTQYGGVTEFLDDSAAHIINHVLKPVSGMDWSSLYGPYQRWAHPDVDHLAQLMRDVYLNHTKYQFKAENAQIVAKSMTIERIAEIISRELE